MHQHLNSELVASEVNPYKLKLVTASWSASALLLCGHPSVVNKTLECHIQTLSRITVKGPRWQIGRGIPERAFWACLSGAIPSEDAQFLIGDVGGQVHHPSTSMPLLCPKLYKILITNSSFIVSWGYINKCIIIFPPQSVMTCSSSHS